MATIGEITLRLRVRNTWLVIAIINILSFITPVVGAVNAVYLANWSIRVFYVVELKVGNQPWKRIDLTDVFHDDDGSDGGLPSLRPSFGEL